MARFLGIDIGDSALRGVLVRSSLRKLEVERYVEIPLTQLPDTPGRLPELNEASRNLLRALGATPDAIVAGLAGEETSLRVIELPAAARKRIAEVLPFELETVLPYDPHDAIIDYQPIASDQGTLRVLSAAVLRPHVAQTLERLRQIGLEPRELAAGAAALDGLGILLPELKAQGPCSARRRRPTHRSVLPAQALTASRAHHRSRHRAPAGRSRRVAARAAAHARRVPNRRLRRAARRRT